MNLITHRDAAALILSWFTLFLSSTKIHPYFPSCPLCAHKSKLLYYQSQKDFGLPRGILTPELWQAARGEAAELGSVSAAFALVASVASALVEQLCWQGNSSHSWYQCFTLLNQENRNLLSQLLGPKYKGVVSSEQKLWFCLCQWNPSLGVEECFLSESKNPPQTGSRNSFPSRGRRPANLSGPCRVAVGVPGCQLRLTVLI